MPIKHAFESEKEDGVDETLVRPSDWNAEHIGRIGKDQLEWTANKLLKGAGAGVNPIEIAIGTGAGEVAAGDHTHTLTLTEEWATLLRTTADSTEWFTVDEITIPSSKKIAVWCNAFCGDSGVSRTGYIQILVDEVQKLYATIANIYITTATYKQQYGAGVQYGGVGGVIECQVKASGAITAGAGGCRGMHSVGV